MIAIAFVMMGFTEGGENVKVVEATRGAKATEEAGMMLDGDKTTKWCVKEFGGAYVVWQNTKLMFVNGYKVTTGNDCEKYKGRNPKNWDLYACKADKAPEVGSKEWVLISSVRQDKKLVDKNGLTCEYELEEMGEYNCFLLKIKKIKGAPTMQIADWEMIGIVSKNPTKEDIEKDRRDVRKDEIAMPMAR